MTGTADNPQESAPVRATPRARPITAETNPEDGRFPLENPKHEMYAQHLAKGMNADKAYAMAGFKPNRGNASVLKAKQSIKSRVAFLQHLSAERTATVVAIDKTWVLKQAVAGYELSAAHMVDESGAFVGAAANAASRFLGQAGDHVDVQAWKAAQDINLHITVDQAIARLESQVIEADYEVIADD